MARIERLAGLNPVNPIILKIQIKNLRRLWRWGPPLPIPNRAVKTTSADGTRVRPGRVSRCLTFYLSPIGQGWNGMFEPEMECALMASSDSPVTRLAAGRLKKLNHFISWQSSTKTLFVDFG